MSPQTGVQTGWFDTVKDKINSSSIKDFFTSSKPIEMAVYVGIGFLIGFFLKKFGKYVALAVMVFIVLAILQQLDLITVGINWRKIQGLLGAEIPAFDQSTFAFYGTWIKENMLAVLMMALGFLLGLRVG